MRNISQIAIDYYNSLGIDINAFIAPAIYKAMLDEKLYGKSSNCLMAYFDPGELAFLYSTGND